MHYEHKLMIAACLIMFVSSLLFVSQEMKAQQNSAAVTATVLPNEYNTRPPRQKSIIESLSVYQKITLGSGALVALFGGIASYLLFTGKQKHIPS